MERDVHVLRVRRRHHDHLPGVHRIDRCRAVGPAGHISKVLRVLKAAGLNMVPYSTADSFIQAALQQLATLEDTTLFDLDLAKMMVLEPRAPSDHLTRASLMWSIRGAIVASPSQQQLDNLVETDYAILLPPPSKTDAFGVIWGDKPIYLPVRCR